MDTQEIRDCDLTGGAVLVIHLPVGKGDTDLREMRDYVAESIDKGVLVLNANTAYKLEHFPPLGGILIYAGGQNGAPAEEPPQTLVLRGKDVPQLAAEAEAADPHAAEGVPGGPWAGVPQRFGWENPPCEGPGTNH